MRDIALVLALLVSLPVTLVYPFAGVLIWAWLSIMSPHREVYSFAYGQPFNLVVAIVTLGAWLVSRERKRFPSDAMPWMMLAFMGWMTLNSFFAADPDWSWPLWSLTIKIFAFALFAMVAMTSKARIHAMVWVIVLSIGYFGVKGGLFTIVTGGNYRVFGPDYSMISDNNQLAVAVAMTLPLVNYLYTVSANRWVRFGLVLSIFVQVLAVLGTYSRGGAIALACLALVFWGRSKRKLIYPLIVLVLVGPALYFMPEGFYNRIDTISAADQDSSFVARVTSWKVSLFYAIDHFPFGAGFAGTQRDAVYHRYFPGESSHAAHSIYFQVLGEHGFPALAIYLVMIGLAFRNASVALRQTRHKEGLEWAEELAQMVRVSLFVFCVGAAALSMAYYDVFVVLLALSSALRVLTKEAPVDPRRASPVGEAAKLPAASEMA
jgi:probable O-glycosylation ligase (exosortase A-associated)